MKTIEEIKKEIEARKTRSAWDKGVKNYAVEMIKELEENISGGYFKAENIADRNALKAQLLNGAKSWSEYSYGGSALIYNGDIAERLCSPSEYKKCREGERKPNNHEEWLDVQARALSQASTIILRLAKD